MSAILSINDLKAKIVNGILKKISYWKNDRTEEANIVKYCLLICDEPLVNSFKYYELYLADNGDVIAKYGRIGKNAVTYLYPNSYDTFFRRQSAKKLAKGYKEFSLEEYKNKAGLIHY